jgi:hypothetical protein
VLSDTALAFAAFSLEGESKRMNNRDREVKSSTIEECLVASASWLEVEP